MADLKPQRSIPGGRALALFTVVGLLVVEAGLFASAHFRWFEFNHHKGWTPLIAVVVALGWLLSFLTLLGISWLRQKPAHFGTMTLLALVSVLALPCAWMASEIQKARRQAAVVQQIKAEGGTVWYHGFSSKPQENTALLGTDYFFDVAYLNLKSPTCLSQLSVFPRLHSLELVGTSITDSDLHKLSESHDLENLYLTGTQITNDGLKHVGAIPHLQLLFIDNTAISDDGLKHLFDLRELELVVVDNLEVSDDAMNHFRKQMPNTHIARRKNVSP